MVYRNAPTEDAIGDLLDRVLARNGYKEQTRYSMMDKIHTLRKLEGAEEILSRTPDLVRYSIISDIGFGVDPSDIVAFLDLVERAGIPWESVEESWPGDASGLTQHSIWMADLFSKLIPESVKTNGEILTFHGHQNEVRGFNLRTSRLAGIFIQLFFIVYEDDAEEILRYWNQNDATAMLFDLVRLADNWRDFKHCAPAWTFTILGVTEPVGRRRRG